MAERGQVTVADRQRAVSLDAGVPAMLATVGTKALELITRRNLGTGEQIDGAAVFLVDDEEIGAVHGEYFDDPSPTDVITFPLGNYGEILLGVEVARRQAGDFGVAFERELALYVVHGLLHLSGHEDASAHGRAEMASLQEAILAEVY